MALYTLLEVPMSLTDLHFMSPFDIEEWLLDTPLRLQRVKTFDHSRANGPLMITDLRKRLTNALRDADLDNSRVESFIDWLDKVVRHREATGDDTDAAIDGGATALYVIRKTAMKDNRQGSLLT